MTPESLKYGIEMEWRNLNNTEALIEIEEISKSNPVLLFKHSTTCSISATALNRMERKWESKSKVIPYFLDLLRHRSVSDEIAKRYGVRHESPQALLIENGKCVFHASHFNIDPDKFNTYK